MTTVNRKAFLGTLGSLGLLPIVGCKTTGGWDSTDTQKLADTLEQAGFVLAVKFKNDSEARKYIDLSVSVLELALQDGKLDPSDLVSVVVANVKNDDVVVALTTALAIYRIWWNDTLPSTVSGATVLGGLIAGLKAGLLAGEVRRYGSPSPAAVQKPVPTFDSKSLDNSVKDFFKRYQE
jgi:hypothetical protein